MSRLDTDHRAARAADMPLELQSLRLRRVCPFCGTINAPRANLCPRCGMEDSTPTRKATESAVGPWFVQQSRNPSAPGMRFSMLLTLIRSGQVRPGSVVRGPTTNQLWEFAARVRGISREFGLCYHCNSSVDRITPICPDCGSTQEPPSDPNTLLDFNPLPPPVFREVSPPPEPPEPPEQPAPLPQSIPKTSLLTPSQIAKAFELGVPASTDPKPQRPRRWLTRRRVQQIAAGALIAMVAAGVAYMNWPASRPASPVAAPTAPYAAPSASSSSDAVALAKTLWQNAIEAESRKDYQAALYYFEQISKLAPAVHPSDLKARTEAARARAKSL